MYKKRNRSAFILIIFLLFAIVLLTGCSSVVDTINDENDSKKNIDDSGERISIKDNDKEDAANDYNREIEKDNEKVVESMEEEIVGNPSIEFDKYKGINGEFREATLALYSVNELKEDGVNIVGMRLNVGMDDHNFNPMEGKLIVKDDIDEIKKTINSLHKNGIMTLVCFNRLSELVDANPEHPEYGDGRVLDLYTPLILEWAEICEELGVEMFYPIHEPQCQVKGNVEELLSEWAQEILPEIKKRYSGKIAFQVQIYKNTVDLYNLNLEGYKYIILQQNTTPIGVEFYSEDKRRAREDEYDSFINDRKRIYPNHKYIDMMEVAVGPDYYFHEPDMPAHYLLDHPGLSANEVENEIVHSEKDQAICYEMLFKKTWDVDSGYLITVLKGMEYRNTLAEAVIREWFNKN